MRPEDSVPELGGTIRLRGLEAPVDVYRDTLGIPHARASSVHDAFFAQGFVHAQDRLWQMTYDQRRAEGRVSELLGPQALDWDVFSRRVGLARTSRSDYAELDGETRGVLDAFTTGVNAYIETVPTVPYELRLLDAEPQPWEPWHPIAILKVRHVLMGSMDTKLWRARLLKVLGPHAALAVGSPVGREDTVIVPVGGRYVLDGHGDALAAGGLAVEALPDGSNGWGVAGSRTTSGLPLVCGDSHRALEVPNVYYQNHVACPDFDAIGFSMPGVPGMFHFGHNAEVAWGITHAMADTQDLYVERFDPQGRYELRGEWLTPERWTESIEVRGAEPETVEVVVTPNGPVVFGDPREGTALSLRWTGTDGTNTTAAALLPMLRAKTVDELEDAMRPWVDPCNSMVMADRQGALAYLYRGRVPIRSEANAWTPVPGWTGEHAWRGTVPFEELPRLRDPEAGYIVTANNRVTDASYPHHLGVDYAAPHRARRILDRLAALDDATVGDMAAVHADRMSLPAKGIVEALGRLSLTGRTAEARDRLTAWDGSMEPDAVEPTIYEAIRDKLAEVLSEREPLRSVVADRFPEEPYPTKAVIRIRGAAPRLLTRRDPSVADDWDEVLQEALDRALDALSQTAGPDPSGWVYGRFHATHVTHPLSGFFPEAAGVLDPAPMPCGGDGDTVQATASYEGIAVDHTSVTRYVFDLADWDRSGWVVPLGASGHPGSPHYQDQAQRWAAVGLYPATYSWEAVTSGAETHQRLERL